MGLGENIKRIRLNQNLTQQQLADNIGLKAITIRKYENNEREPNIQTLQKIAIALNSQIGDFLGNEFNNYPESSKKYIYKLITESNFIESILEYFGYSLTSRMNLESEYEFELIDCDGKVVILSSGEMDDFIIDLKELIKFEISRVINRHNRKEFSNFIDNLDKEGE